MTVLNDALDKLGELANQLYDDAQVDNKVAEAAQAAHDAVDALRERVGKFLDRFEDDDAEPPTEPEKSGKVDTSAKADSTSKAHKGGQS